MQGSPILRFDDFELDVATRELLRKGRKVSLAPQPFRLLTLLAGSPGRIIGRDEIRKELWNSTHVDFEHGVNFCVREIRRALRDRADRPRYIETLPRQGYRFLANVIGGRQGFEPGTQVDPRIKLADLLSEGRRLLREMSLGTLDQGRKIFEEALNLDPDCAIAHCGLGATKAIQYISRCERSDLNLAKYHLERATELDPELAEPYPWLCYVHLRCGELEKSLDFGRRGVQLLPGLAHAHYFLGAAYFATCEMDTSMYPEALMHLLQASRSDPSSLPVWVLLSLLFLMNGEYESAGRFAQHLFQFESAGAVTRFPGAENLMGTIALRKGDFDGAIEWFHRSLATLSTSNHTYSVGMKAWCACGLGDIELRRGNPADSLAHYRSAWQMVQESPAILAQERHATRAQVGLAAAYAAAGESDRAIRLLLQAEQRLPSCLSPAIFSPAMNLADLYYAFAVAWTRAKDWVRAIDHLRHAVRSGWLDKCWLLQDTEVVPLHGLSAFPSLLAEIDSQKRDLDVNPELLRATSTAT